MLGLTNGSYAEIDEFADGHWIQSAQDGVADGRGEGFGRQLSQAVHVIWKESPERVRGCAPGDRQAGSGYFGTHIFGRQCVRPQANLHTGFRLRSLPSVFPVVHVVQESLLGGLDRGAVIGTQTLFQRPNRRPQTIVLRRALEQLP